MRFHSRSPLCRSLIVGIVVAIAATALSAQAPSGVEGRWEGALVGGGTRLRLVVDITKTADGVFLGTLTSVDQGGVKIPLSSVKPSGDSLRCALRAHGSVGRISSRC